jgi:O-antigen/teichoic acid export membrane protein
MLIASFFITPDPVIQKVIWILAVYISISNFGIIIYAFLRARQKMEYEAGAKILQALILVGIGFFILFKFPSIENISYGYLFANLMALIFILTFFHFRVSSLNLNWDKNIWQKFFRFSWPLGLAYVFSAVFVNVDSVIMGSWGQFTEAGWYNAVHRIVGLTTLPAMLIFTSFYPVLSKLLKESKEKLQKVWNYYLESMIILATPIAVGGLVLAPKIVYSFFGQSFGPSILAFQILIFMAGINFLYNPYILILIVSNQQKKYLWVSLIAAVTNTILNLILIPYYSLYGAAFVALFTALLIFFLLVKASSQLVSITPFNVRNFLIFLISISASLLMYFLISNPKIYALNVFLLILIGIGTYFFFFLILKKIVSQFFKILL